MRTATLLASAALLAVLCAAPARAQLEVSALNCSTAPTGHVRWPNIVGSTPVWEFDFVRPSANTTTRGAGLELRNVKYNGRLVMNRGHVPILNVLYESGGGCNCYRDWSYSEAGIATGTTLPGSNSCVAIAAPGAVRSTCEVNAEGGSGGDPGSFLGVGIEDFGSELVLTGNMQAGWYRYRMKWHFYPDGRIWPEYSYSAASATCTSASHRHHAYWRFDFDLEGTPTNDVIREVNPTTNTTTEFTTEVQRTWGTASDGVYWTVRDGATSNVGYDIVPSSIDRQLAIDSFSKLDFMALQYHAGVYDDGTTSLSDCAIHQERMVDTPGSSTAPENLVGVDTEVWYRSSALHTGGNPWECDIVGPTLRPQGYGAATGTEPPPPANGLILESAVPNPFNPTTSIRFRLAEAQYLTVVLYDVTGRQITTLFDGYARENREEIVTVDGSNLPGGTYIVRLEGENVQGSTRIVLLK